MAGCLNFGLNDVGKSFTGILAPRVVCGVGREVDGSGVIELSQGSCGRAILLQIATRRSFLRVLAWEVRSLAHTGPTSPHLLLWIMDAWLAIP